MTPKISIIHPSRSRPEHAGNTIRAWLNTAANPNDIEYLLSVDSTDPELPEYELYRPNNFRSVLLKYHTIGDVSTNLPTITLVVNDNHSAIEAINRAAIVSTGNLIIVVSDDFSTPPKHWDVQLLDSLEGKHDYIVKTDDGVQPWIITLPIMDRQYYNRFGYVYYPEYKHLFCDTEMTHVADLLDRKITLPIRIPHNHYTTGKTQRDAINIKNDSTWGQGEALYLNRVLDGFGLVNPPGVLRCDNGHARWLKSKGFEIESI